MEGLLTHEIDLALCVSGIESKDVAAISDCSWTDTIYVVAATDHPLRAKGKLQLKDTLTQQWALTPKGTEPYAHVKETFEARGLPMPVIAVETRSVTVLKSLVARCGFVSWMAEPMYDSECRAGVVDALDIEDLDAQRTLTAFRRRRGIMPAPAVKLLDELRHLAITPFIKGSLLRCRTA